MPQNVYHPSMRLRDIDGLLTRWQDRGLISQDQVSAIRAFEVEDRADEALEEDEPSFDIGALLSYGGALVALGAVMGLYATLFDDIGSGGSIPVTWGVALGAAVLAFMFARARGGNAAADATGFATTILLAWAVLELFDAIGWFGSERVLRGETGFHRDLVEERFAWLVTSTAVAGAGYALARLLPSPMSAASAVVALIWAAAVLGGWIGSPSDDGPGLLGSQFAVIMGLVLAALAILDLLELPRRATLWWLIGSLGAANVFAVYLSADEGGAFEALLLAYAIGLGLVSIIARRKVVLVFAALFLYEWVGFVVFRTFEGAVAAIIVTALVGLGTAVGGIAVQRGIVEQLWRLRGGSGSGRGDSPAS